MFVFLMQFPNICVFSKMLCSDSDYLNLLMIVTLGCGPVLSDQVCSSQRQLAINAPVHVTNI